MLLALTLLVAAPIMCFGGIFMALRQDVELSGLLLLVLPALIISIGLVIRQMRPLFRVMQVKIDAINGIMREQIMGIRVIRAFVKEDYEAERFGEANREMMEVAIAVGRLMSMMFPIVMLIMNVSVVLAMWFGGYRIGSGDLQVGTLTAFQNYLVQILMSVMMATFMLMLWPRAEVSAERITEVLDTEPSVVAPTTRVQVTLDRGRIDIRGASFAFPGAEHDVLHEIDLVARPGETTAIIGSTGSGKSTLLGLVPRLFDATAGRSRSTATTSARCTPRTSGRRSGWCRSGRSCSPARSASNLRYGRPDATDAEVWEALEIAQATDFVTACPSSSTHRSRRAAPTSPAVSASASRSRARSSRGPGSTCSTTRSPRWTTRPTRPAGRAAYRHDGGGRRDRRPTGLHDPWRRPHRRPRRGPRRRHRHARRPDGVLRGLPRDRPVPADARGGRMSERSERIEKAALMRLPSYRSLAEEATA